MRVLFYSKYIPDHFGGGEKHLFDVATTVAHKHEVFISVPHSIISRENDKKAIIEKYEKFLNYSLDTVQFVSSILNDGSIYEKLKETKKYDYVYYATDGSFFLSMAKKNNLHIQIPLTNKLNLWQKIKLASWQIKNTNSEFTKNVIEKSWNTTVNFVHHPMVSLEEIQLGKNKEKIILHVGRFFKQLHSKRQDILVSFFKKLIDQNSAELSDWRLVLVGSVEDEQYLQEVIDLSKSYPIEIKTNVTRDELINLYKKAKIYWHATGFGIDEMVEPEKVEHFGISTIEAMAAGCVPVVINKGGQKEIIGTKLSNLLWNSQEDCLTETIRLIINQEHYVQMQQEVLERVKLFSRQEFEKVLWEMF